MYKIKAQKLINLLTVIIRDCDDTKVSGLYADYRSDEQNFLIQQRTADACRWLISKIYKLDEDRYIKTGLRNYLDQEIMYEFLLQKSVFEHFDFNPIASNNTQHETYRSIIIAYIRDRILQYVITNAHTEIE